MKITIFRILCLNIVGIVIRGSAQSKCQEDYYKRGGRRFRPPLDYSFFSF